MVIFVRNQTAEENYPIIGNDLFNMFLAVAIVTTLLLVVIVIGEWIIVMVMNVSHVSHMIKKSKHISGML